MCRSIVSLRDLPDPTSTEVEAAARQFVRKISGTKARTPSRANQEAFDHAIEEIAAAASRMLADWVVAGRDVSPAGSPPALTGRHGPPART